MEEIGKMIPDETYLKMILALPGDFFEKVEPAFGNLYWVETYQGWKEGYSRKTYAVCSMVLDTGTYYLSLQDRTNFDEVIGSWEFEYSKRDKAIHWRKWLIPSQEQLQKMLKSNILTDAGNLWHVFCTFDEFVHSEYERRSFLKTGKLISDSFEMLWLSCVMKTKYNQIWDGNAWADEEK